MAFAWLGGAGSTRRVSEIWFAAAELLRSHSVRSMHGIPGPPTDLSGGPLLPAVLLLPPGILLLNESSRSQ